MDSYTLSALHSAAGIMALMLGSVVVAGWMIALVLNAWWKRSERRMQTAKERALRIVNDQH